MDKNIILLCPYCGGPTKKAGFQAGKPRRKCKVCSKTYVAVLKRCVVCGNPVPRERYFKNTCCDACYDQRKRDIAMDYYYRVSSDHNYQKKRTESRKQNPNYILQKQQADKRQWEKTKMDPERLERARKNSRNFYKENAKRINLARKKRIESMSPEELADYIKKERERVLIRDRRRREEMQYNPELLARFKEKETERARRRRLNKLLKTMQELEEKL